MTMAIDDDRTTPKPLSPSTLRRRKDVAAETDPPGGRFTLQSFRLPEGAEAKLEHDRSDPGAYRLVVATKHDGVEALPVRDRIEVEALGREHVTDFDGVRELDGFRPSHATIATLPNLVGRPLTVRKDEDEPAHVFPPDSRYIYQDTAFPWRTVGRVWTAGGVGSGCTIGRRLVLTASHVVDWRDDGGVGWAKFSPGYYNGNGPWGEFNATRVIYWNRALGGLSDLETAFDYAIFVIDSPVGDHVGYAGYRSYDDDWNGGAFWQHMGYPGDLSGTQRPAFVGSATVSSTSDESLSGQDGLVMGHFNDITPGHSGGPVWGWWSGEPWPRVVGVQSAQASTPALNTSGDNEFGGGSALSALISYARTNYP